MKVDNPGLFQGDQSALEHPLDQRQHGIYLVLKVDDFNDHRQVATQTQKTVGMHFALGAVTHRAFNHRGTVHTLVAKQFNKRFLKRPLLVTVALADKDPHQGHLFLN